jgi:tetratricopeptide (TPR) repeat protein/SAM-dependent methyltransferase
VIRLALRPLADEAQRETGTMNRNERREADKQSRRAALTDAPRLSRPAAARVHEHFAEALRHHRSGRLAQASEFYRRVIEIDPEHTGSLQNLGAIAASIGRNDAAVDLFSRAIAIDDRNPAYHYNIAVALRALGRLDAAAAHARKVLEVSPDDLEAHLVVADLLNRQGDLDQAAETYELALAIAPDRAQIHNSLGGLRAAQGRADEARAGFERALALDPALVAAHVNLGNLDRSDGQHEKAIESFLRAIELDALNMDAHNSLCAVLLAQAKFGAVAAHFEQILELKPDYVQGYITSAIAYLGAGDPSRALEAILRAFEIAETPEGKSLFVMCLKNANAVPESARDKVRGLIVRAMSEPWGRPGEMTRHCVSMIKGDPDLGKRIERAAKAWPERLPVDRLFGTTGLQAAARDPVLRCLLENARVDDVAMERYLTSARLALLDAAMSACVTDTLDPDILVFYCALARQCFINEYVYATTGEEAQRAADLRERLVAALLLQDPVPVLWPVAVAAYAPLHTLRPAHSLLPRHWPRPVQDLLTQQVREPAEEHRLGETIPRLTPIDDEVSVLVQSQYEENPYPRWVKAAPASRPTPIDALLRNQFPLARYRNIDRGRGLDVLVAGCGTGQQVVDVAHRIAGAKVLAIDLSLASLCYGKRQTEALGIGNIEYGQADILQLGQLNRRFHVIDCGGVLHHLGDPLEGWRVLRSLLRRNGVMRIALYSDIARRHIVAGRDFVAERGYGRAADEIRRFRQDVLALPDEDPVKRVARSPDFFSVSDCRDLVFHVQEHRFTLLQIWTHLADLRLEFLGFETESKVLARYSARFPDDPARTDLYRWHVFEMENPATFAGMYQFWVQAAD